VVDPAQPPGCTDNCISFLLMRREGKLAMAGMASRSTIQIPAECPYGISAAGELEPLAVGASK
jgi:hypothetical protein